MDMKQYIPLGNVISKASVDRCGDRHFPILSITMKDGLVLQDEKFKKRIASVDTSDYKVISRGKLVQGIHIDEANFGIQNIVDAGIVSPAYRVWDVRTEIIFPKYLEMVMRSPRSLAFYKSKLNGSVNRRGRMTDADFLAMQIPFVPYPEQEKAVAIINQVQSIKAYRESQLATLDELIKARFVEMFGDLANPACKWEKCRLVDACVNSDDIKCGPFGTQLGKDEYTEEGVAVWEIPQINSEFKTLPTHFVTEKKAAELDAYSIIPDDIAMSRKGNVGRCAVFPSNFEKGIIHSDVLRIRLDETKAFPEFMMRQLHYSGDIQHQIELVSSGAIMAGINVTKLKQIFVYLPPIDLQGEYVSFVAQVDKSKFAMRTSLDYTIRILDGRRERDV